MTLPTRLDNCPTKPEVPAESSPVLIFSATAEDAADYTWDRDTGLLLSSK